MPRKPATFRARLWRYPGPRQPPKGGFYFPDDAFFTRRGRGIISNEEENETIVELDYPSGRLTRSFGHPGVIGSGPGYFHEPDDAPPKLDVPNT